MHVYVWKEIVNMSIGWAPNMIGWACAQPWCMYGVPVWTKLMHQFWCAMHTLNITYGT